MVEDDIDRGTRRLDDPIARRHVLSVLFAQAIILLLVVVGDLRSLTRREAHLAQLRRSCAGCGLLLLAMLSGKGASLGAAVDVVFLRVVIRRRLHGRVVASTSRRCFGQLCSQRWEKQGDVRMHTWAGAGGLLTLPSSAGVDIVGVFVIIASLNLQLSSVKCP